MPGNQAIRLTQASLSGRVDTESTLNPLRRCRPNGTIHLQPFIPSFALLVSSPHAKQKRRVAPQARSVQKR